MGKFAYLAGYKAAIEKVWQIASEYGHHPLCDEDCDAGCELIQKLWKLRETTHKDSLP